ncbi:unnamed protein product [Adineta ricciae]|uniref:Uncharacterized protein n=1 Tax=Adineta ricciae TaxID=249248 RepID=A0A813RXU3_ADIRI|nr:unnamed protein product [Adineta ricciae]
MANQTMMMIVTSNKDLIRQVSLSNASDTHIVNLDVFANHYTQSKSTQVSKKPTDCRCTICGDRASGFNYNALSCASCKIFFRRNIHQREKLKCLLGERQCLVSYGIRRRCPQCREERKQQRRKYFQETRKNDSVYLNQLNSTTIAILPDDDLVLTENLRSLFLLIFEKYDVQCACVDVSDRMSALISWSQFVSRVALKFIRLLRQIHQFEDLSEDDRFILVKYNVFSLCLMSKCFYYKPEDDCCSNDDCELSRRHRRFFMLCGDTFGIRDTFVDMVLLLVKVTEQDPVFLSLLSIMLLFTQGLSMNENEPTLNDSLAVNRAHCYYTALLWKYLVGKRDEIQARKQFIHLVTLIIRIQVAGKKIRDFFSEKMMTTDIMHRLAPLMQTLLHRS